MRETRLSRFEGARLSMFRGRSAGRQASRHEAGTCFFHSGGGAGKHCVLVPVYPAIKEFSVCLLCEGDFVALEKIIFNCAFFKNLFNDLAAPGAFRRPTGDATG